MQLHIYRLQLQIRLEFKIALWANWSSAGRIKNPAAFADKGGFSRWQSENTNWFRFFIWPLFSNWEDFHISNSIPIVQLQIEFRARLGIKILSARHWREKKCQCIEKQIINQINRRITLGKCENTFWKCHFPFFKKNQQAGQPFYQSDFQCIRLASLLMGSVYV